MCRVLRRCGGQDLAFGSFHLFMKQIPTSPDELKVRIIQVIIDVFMVHEVHFLANEKVRLIFVSSFLPYDYVAVTNFASVASSFG